MYNQPRRVCIFPAVCGLVLVGILLSSMVASPVRADVGVQPILPGGSNIKPEGQTPIQMAAEKVVLNVHKATEADNAAVKLNPEAYGYQISDIWYPAVADVTADFTMKNPTGEALSMMVWFPLASSLENDRDWELNPDEIVPRIESLQVAVDGKPLEFSVSELPNPNGEDKPPLPWASFPVTFPAEKEIHIQVSYLLPAQSGLDYKDMVLYYVFQTGAGWAGPIGKAELVVNLPYPASAETIGAAPKGGQAGGQQVRWIWKNLEPGPKDDFSIWLIQPRIWEEVQATRLAVKANPEDGQAWLKLASTYSSLTRAKYVGLARFGPYYQPLGVKAYQEAARLLPVDADPHYGLALLYLAPLPQNPSPEELQPVLDELKIGEELEAKQPGREGLPGSGIVQDNIELYLYNDATATADAATWTAEATYTYGAETADWATREAWLSEAGRDATQTASPAATQPPNPTRTLTPLPSATLGLVQTALAVVAPPTPTLSQPGNEGS